MSTKDEIIDAAVKLFTDYGYHKATMDLIAEEVGVAKGTIYWYFSSKKELFMEILKVDFHRYFDFLQELRDNNQLNSQEKMETIIVNRMDHFEKHKPIFRELMTNNEEIDKEFKEEMMGLRDKHAQLLADLFSQGIENGEFEIEDSYIAALAFMGINISISNDNLLTNQENKERTARILKDFIFNGIMKK